MKYVLWSVIIAINGFAWFSYANPEQLRRTIQVLKEASEQPVASTTPSTSPAIAPPARTKVNETIVVRFKLGEDSIVLKGQLSSKTIQPYIINCRAGQRFYAAVNQPEVLIELITPSGKLWSATTGGEFELTLPESGDYRLRVSSQMEAQYGVLIEVK